MGFGINRREFLKRGTLAGAVLSASRRTVRGATTGLPSTEKSSIRRLASRLRGEVLLPEDKGYEAACRDWTGAIPKRPGFVVRPAETQDIVTAVKFARDHDLLVAVRAGGHGFGSTCEGGMLLNLGKMKKVTVDSAKRVARAEAGVLAGEFDRATCAQGLATVLGECPSVGLSGLTLGGGLGRLTGKYGALCDNLLSAEVITANGQVLTSSMTENADLFWGIRGGGGNFGIVASFEYRLHPVSTVLSGTLRYPTSQLKPVLRFIAEYMLAAPDELDAIVDIGSGGMVYAPDAQEPAVVINVCCGGELSAAEKTLRPLRSFRASAVDTIGPMSYLEAQSQCDLTPVLKHATDRYSGYSKTGFITRLNDNAIEAVTAHCEKPPSPIWSVELGHCMHGEVCRVPESAMAFSLRQPGYSLFLDAFEERPATGEAAIMWGQSLHKALEPFSGGRMYLNLLTDSGESGVRAAFGNNYQRLVAVKSKYDPTNFFHLNPNIAPKQAASARSIVST